MAKVVSTKTDFRSLPGGIFFWDADWLVPAWVEAEQEFQKISHLAKRNGGIMGDLITNWATYAGPAGIAQYSLRKDTTVGVLGYAFGHFRNADHAEMSADFDELGEQVIGPKVEETTPQMTDNPTLRVWGEEYVYVGWPRIEGVTVSTLVFPTETWPTDISDLITQLDDIAPSEDRMIVPQQYMMFVATRGTLEYLAFADPQDYRSSSAQPHGSVSMEGDRFYFHPQPEIKRDFTPSLVRF